MNYSHRRHKILPSVLRVLYRPWLISLGLHGLLLMIPVPSRFEPPVSQTSKPLKEVKITDLPASPKQATSKPSPKSSAKISRPSSSNTSTSQQDINTPLQLPKPKPTPSVTPTPKPTPPVSLTPEPTPSETPGVKIEGGALETFLGELTATSETPGDKASKPRPDLFSEPDLFFDQSSSNDEPKLKSGILRMVWINGKTPDQVQVQVLSSQKSGKRFQISELGNYGGGKIYKVEQESNTWYLNLVPTKGSDGTVVVAWKQDPNRSSKVR